MSDVGDITVPVEALDVDRFREIAAEEIQGALERAKERYAAEASVGTQSGKSEWEGEPLELPLRLQDGEE